MAAMSDYLEQRLLNHVFRGVTYTPPATLHLALFTTVPTDAAPGTEVTGGSYSRQPVTFTAPDAAGKVSNDALVTYTNMPETTVIAAAVMDSSSGGNMLMYGTLTASRTVASGDDLTVAAGDLNLYFA